MKKLLAVAFSVSFFSSLAFANGPRFYCQSDDGVKSVRVSPGPFGKMQANVYHNGSLHASLKCEQNAGVSLYSCQDDSFPPRRFSLDLDRRNARYEGSHEVRDLTCRFISETAE
ncbi:MAG: hypothetical protein KA436_00625 [Oligoflexales bacterium]|nr:hypothetical protein [Oligoflexales bacterium]